MFRPSPIQLQENDDSRYHGCHNCHGRHDVAYGDGRFRERKAERRPGGPYRVHDRARRTGLFGEHRAPGGVRRA
ncbi:hypothetical protein [Streptomyces mobaraensis]|uniref:Uncharacterized protein n=1 Tax=Streptomyces mobaraensis (strain ATCC 29032 / DSM 40847 / JCM 4168 / NBRC 13819 / NCIMB 11159 / IPCR 16-22) TaxID=1223523 RepID=M3CDH5_STRM1|nr:hypothetical protein [Streptomyces mobaraensis]EMF02127.1 hypothetical protein H340_02819 [Streptomyces mobaraensis NBRC 13819 = DSM 40847]